MKAKIKAIEYYLPEMVLTNELISKDFPEWSIEKISDKTGIFERHITRHNECSSDLAVESAKKLFAEHNIKPEEVDFLLLCTQSPDYFLPTTACLVQNRLGLRIDIGALDFNLGCSGYIYGLSLAKGLIESGTVKNVLLITAETYSKFIHDKDKSVKTIFGDGSSSTLISAVEGEQDFIKGIVLGTDGRGAENLIVKTGGMRNPRTYDSGKDYLDKFGNTRNDDSLFMNGAEIFNFTLRTIPNLVKNVYEKSLLSESEIALFVFHQANKYMNDFLRKKLNIKAEKYIEYLANCGNTVSSTIPIALCNATKEGKVKDGQNIMLVGFGVGYSWGACIVNL